MPAPGDDLGEGDGLPELGAQRSASARSRADASKEPSRSANKLNESASRAGSDDELEVRASVDGVIDANAREDGLSAESVFDVASVRQEEVAIGRGFEDEVEGLFGIEGARSFGVARGDFAV